MQLKSMIMDESAVLRSMKRITHEIIEKNNGASDIILLGIHRRGMPLAAMLKENIRNFEGTDVPLGSIDISLYRDDLSTKKDQPIVNETAIDFSVTDKIVVLVDDVLFTGRTARAAMDAVIALGRPAKIQLCELVDRGHRELPIRADFVGKNVPTSLEEIICVKMPEYDGSMGINIERK